MMKEHYMKSSWVNKCVQIWLLLTAQRSSCAVWMNEFWMSLYVFYLLIQTLSTSCWSCIIVWCVLYESSWWALWLKQFWTLSAVGLSGQSSLQAEFSVVLNISIELYILRAGPSLMLRIFTRSTWVNNRKASPSICWNQTTINYQINIHSCQRRRCNSLIQCNF